MSVNVPSGQDAVKFLMRELLTEVSAIREQLGSNSEARSSVEITTSTRGYDIKVKAYVGSDVEAAGNAAMDEYLRLREQIEKRLMGQA